MVVEEEEVRVEKLRVSVCSSSMGGGIQSIIK